MAQPIEIVPSGPLRGALAAPGSKSATNRALVLAALADGTSTIATPLLSDDTEAMIGCLRALGVTVEHDGASLRVQGSGGALTAPTQPLDARFSGTTMRYLTAVAALAPGMGILEGRGGLMRRPIAPLLSALQGLGARVAAAELPPVRFEGGGLEGGEVTVDATASSQFATAILLVAPYARRDVVMHVENLGATGFVEMTAAMMREWGAEVERLADGSWRVAAGVTYQGRAYTVEYDASAAAHLFALAVATAGEVTVTNASPATLQPDAAITGVLEQMGARVSRDGDELTVAGPEEVRSIDVDLRTMPDQLPTVAALAALASATTTITGVAITRGHETDRISALAGELAKLGVRTEQTADGLTVAGAPTTGARLSPHEDHRLAMAFASLGARAPGVVIEDPGCVAKTYPHFWDDAAHLGLRSR